MLQRLTIDSFKAFAHAEVPLGPFTVVIGPNGSGKTTVLQGLEFLGAMVRGSLPEHLADHGWVYRDLPRLRSESTEFSFTVHLELPAGEFEWRLACLKRRRAGVSAEHVRRLGADGLYQDLMVRTGRTMSRLDESTGDWEEVTQTLTASWLSAVDLEEDLERFPGLVAVAGWAGGAQPYVTLDPLQLRGASARTPGGIGRSGEQLAGFLRALRDRSPERFRGLLQRVREQYAPLEDLTIRQAPNGQHQIEVRESWGEHSTAFNARQVSDGLLRLLAVAAVYELDPPPTLLMFDELENGVHPRLLGGLVGLLDELGRSGRTQVVATSHSPVAVNFVEDAESVLIAVRDRAGDATVVPLANAPGYAELEGVLGLGEAWVNAGEDRLLSPPLFSS